MAYTITCPRCSKEFKVKNEAEHSKKSKEHEIICPDTFFDKIKSPEQYFIQMLFYH